MTMTRSDYEALLRWADDGGVVIDIELYEIRDNDSTPTAACAETDGSPKDGEGAL